MPRTEEQKAKRRIYEEQNKEKNKEKIAKRNKAYYLKNKEKKKDKQKAYYQEHKEYFKEYSQTPPVIKKRRIGDWKRGGLICDDFDELYEKYINTKNCENCEVELTQDKRNTKTTRVLDHDHDTGLFRNILCHSCNSKLPKQTTIGEI